MTASNLRIVPKNDYDDAVLTPSAAAVVGFEVENTQNTIRDKVWRTTSNASQSITGVWSTTRSVNRVALYRHLCHAGSWRFQLFADAGATSQVYDSGTISATSYTATEPYVWSEGSNDPFLTRAPTWKWFTATAARSFKITFSGTPSQAFWQVSRIRIGRYMQFVSGPDFGSELGLGDLTDRERTQGGSLRTNESETWRIISLSLHNVRPVEGPSLRDILEYASTSKDIEISVYPEDGTRLEALWTLAGRVSNLNSVQRQVQRFTGRIQIEEN